MWCVGLVQRWGAFFQREHDAVALQDYYELSDVQGVDLHLL